MTGAGRWDGSEPPSPPRGTSSGRSRHGGVSPRDDRSGDGRADGRRTGDAPSRDRAGSTRRDGAAVRTRGEDRRAAAGDRASRGRRAAAATRSRDDEREARDGSGPLRASWEPGRRPRALPRPPRRRMWALYLVPLLVVVTVLAVVQTVHHDESGDTADGVAGPDSPAPIVGEAPRGSFADVNIPTAELPPGGAFPVRGRGTWHVVPGATPQTGVGRVFTYTVEVEDGAAVPEGDAAFATAVDATLTDPRSWVGSQRIAMQRVDATSPRPPDFRVSLSSQLTTRAQCGYAIRYEASCWKPDIDRVLINGARWVRGAGAFDGQLGLYRQYAINHEVGHVFRNQHVPCPVNGGLAPVMMQQSFGTANDYLAQLTEENPQGTQIPRDGKTCQPNPWPYPEGAIAPAG